jgi:signal peptidase
MRGRFVDAGVKAGIVLVGAGMMLVVLAFAPTLFGYESFVVTSGSMGGSAPVGSVVLTRMVDARAIASGDVITYRHPGADVVTHRVLAIENREQGIAFRTKGDANAAEDPVPFYLREGRSVARVERVVPFAGHIVGLGRTGFGVAVLVGLPLIGFALDRGRDRSPRRTLPPVVRRSPTAQPVAGPATQQPVTVRHLRVTRPSVIARIHPVENDGRGDPGPRLAVVAEVQRYGARGWR